MARTLAEMHLSDARIERDEVAMRQRCGIGYFRTALPPEKTQDRLIRRRPLLAAAHITYDLECGCNKDGRHGN